MPFGSMEVVTSRNLMVSRRSFIHSVLKPRRLPGFEPTQASLVDHSGLVQKQTSALAAGSSRPPSTYSSLKMWMFEPPNTTARRAGPSGIRP